MTRPSKYERAKARMERAAVRSFLEQAPFPVPAGWVCSVDKKGLQSMPIIGPNGEEVRHEDRGAHRHCATGAYFNGRCVGVFEPGTGKDWWQEIAAASLLATGAARKAGALTRRARKAGRK